MPRPLVTSSTWTATDSSRTSCGEDVTCVLGVTVTDGILSTKFGPVHPNAFDGNERWLEMSVDGSPLSRVEMVTAPAASERVNRPGTVAPAIKVDTSGKIDLGVAAELPDGIVKIDSAAGKVGIGKPPGTEKLEVLGKVKSTDGKSAVTLDGGTGEIESTGPSMRFRVGGQTSVTIDAAGKVGIGTTSPSALLHIAGTAGEDGIMFPDGTLQTTAVTGGGGAAWSLTGNAGTSPGTNFVGTTDDVALELSVNGRRALRLEPDATSPNVIGGVTGNSATAGVRGATIGGGGENIASGAQSTVGGGGGNQASGLRATIPGGASNTAAGDNSFAAGFRAKANHDGAFVWAGFTQANFASTLPSQFNVRARGGTRIFSNSTATVGVELAPGGNSWSAISDRALKENFIRVDSARVLEKLARVPITRWNLKSQDPSIRHIGAMAQDFYAAFGVGESERHISTSDADGVALAAIQGLYEIVKEKEGEIDALQTRVAALEDSVRKMGPLARASTFGGVATPALALVALLGLVAIGRTRKGGVR